MNELSASQVKKQCLPAVVEFCETMIHGYAAAHCFSVKTSVHDAKHWPLGRGRGGSGRAEERAWSWSLLLNAGAVHGGPCSSNLEIERLHFGRCSTDGLTPTKKDTNSKHIGKENDGWGQILKRIDGSMAERVLRFRGAYFECWREDRSHESLLELVA